MTRVRRAVPVAALVAAVTLGTSGCDALRIPQPSPSPTAATSSAALPTTGEVLVAVRTSALSADSGRAVGTVGAGSAAPRLEVEGASSGDDQRLVRTVAGRGTAVLLTVGDGHWLAGDLAFWRTVVPAATAPSRVGRWVPTTDAQVAEVAPETLRGLVTALLDAPAVARLEGSTTPVVATELGGRAAWVVGTATTGGRLWVAADGSGELLRATITGTGAVDLVFDRWGRATSWDAPAATERPVVPSPSVVPAPPTAVG